MQWLKRAVIGIVVLVVLGVGALFAIPTERVAAAITDRISAATGREVSISGEVSPTLWPHLGVRAEGVRVANPDWVLAGPLFVADSLHVGIGWSTLIGGELRLQEAELVGPDIVLMRAADGRESWIFDDGAEGDTGSGGGAGLGMIGFDEARITGGAVRWIDDAAGQDIRVNDIDARLTLPSAEGRATLEIEARYADAALSLEAAVEGVGPLLEGQVRNAALSLDWDGGSAGFTGRLSLAPAFDGDVTLEARDLSPLLGLAGIAMPDLPEGLGRARIDASGRVTFTDAGTAHLRGGTIRLDDNRLEAELDMQPGRDRPRISGVLRADDLDLALMTEDSAPSAGPPGWPVDRIDPAPLFALDADLDLSLGTIDLGAAEVGPIEMEAVLDRGRLALDIDRAGVYGGRLSGSFVINGRNTGSVGGDLILAGVQLNPLLTRFADWDRLEGQGSASLQFLGVGDDIDSIMSSLSGSGDLSFGAGAILGLDIGGMIRNFEASFQGEGERTVYDGIGANFSIENGVLTNDDLLLEAPWGEVRGEGSVDLGARQLEYRVIPGLLRDADGVAGVQVPVLISGSWDAPRFRPDLEFLAQQELEDQRARIEAEAQALIDEQAAQVQERIGAEVDRIGETVQEQTGGLLQGFGTRAETGDGETSEGGAFSTESVIERVLGGEGSRVLQFLGGEPPAEAAPEEETAP